MGMQNSFKEKKVENMTNFEQIKKDLNKLGNAQKAKDLARFFKTGKGEYGEGDKFLGIYVPDQRKVARKYVDLSLSEVQKLFSSGFHEYRLTALFVLIFKFQKGHEREKERIFKFYLKNTKNINNWDLVDLSAPKIVGKHLLEKDRKVLYRLVKSKNLWERRIAILATFAFICENDFSDSLRLSTALLFDEHDLIRKAVGWMLREIGKRNLEAEDDFLKKHYRIMPRTMLRYAIERFPEEKRKAYLRK